MKGVSQDEHDEDRPYQTKQRRHRISEDILTLWMIKESTMKNKIELREEREVEIANFIGVSPIRNQTAWALLLLHLFEHNFKRRY